MNKFLEPFFKIDTGDLLFELVVDVHDKTLLHFQNIQDLITKSLEYNNRKKMFIRVFHVDHYQSASDSEADLEYMETCIDNIIKKDIKNNPVDAYKQLLKMYNFDLYIYYLDEDYNIRCTPIGMTYETYDTLCQAPHFNLYTIMNHDYIHQYNKGDLIQSEDCPDFFEYVLDNGGNPFTTDKRFNINTECYMEYDTIMIPHRKRYFNNRIQDNHTHSLHAWDNMIAVDKNKLSKKKKEYIDFIEYHIFDKKDYGTIEDFIDVMDKEFFNK